MLTGKNKVITVFIILLFVFTAAAGFLYSSGLLNPPERKPAAVFRSSGDYFNPQVSAETIVIKYREYICGDLEKVSEEIAPGELQGLDKKTLAGRFPAAEGWTVNFSGPGVLTLTGKSNEFCTVHRTYRHLGVYHGLVAVYEGPLGFNEKVLRVESIPLDSLEEDFRIKIEQAMDFDKLALPAAEKLREELEFSSDEALNAALENLDENS